MHRISVKCIFINSLVFLTSLQSYQVCSAKRTLPLKLSYGDLLFEGKISEKISLLIPEALIDRFDENESSDGLNGKCRRDLVVYKKAIDRKQRWALKMLDASSKAPSGIFHGNIVDLGTYDECVATKSTQHKIHGRHCTYSFRPVVPNDDFLPIYPMLSICLPSSCTAGDVYSLVNSSIYADARRREIVPVMASLAHCADDFNTSYTAALGFFSSLVIAVYIAFLLFCTRYHSINRQIPPEKRSRRFKLFLRFSYIENVKAVFSTATTDDDVPIIHGMRFMGIAWLILVQDYFFELLKPSVNLLDIQEWFTSWSSLCPLVGLNSVDTFFTISGFLVSYKFFKKIKKNEEFSLGRYYLHRVFRLTPPVIVVLFGAIVFVPILTSGPRWDWLQSIFISGCSKKWWATLLYAHNLVDTDDWCLFHLWTISANMQLYLISPLILFSFLKKPKVGLIVWIILFAISITLPTAILGYNGYSAIYFTREPDIRLIVDAFRWIFQMPYTRAAPWLIGLLFGYEVNYDNFKPDKLTLCKGWFVTSLAYSFCIFCTRTFTESDYVYSPFWEMIFTALHRPAWSFVICWFIYANFHGCTGWISKFLSLKIFLPLSRISFSIYLVQFVLPLLQIGSIRSPRYFSELRILHAYVGNLILSIVMGFAFCATFEKPALALEQLIMGKEERPIEVAKNKKEK